MRQLLVDQNMSQNSILIFGGSGKVSRCLTPLLAKSNYTVHSIIRNESQIPDLESLGATPIVQSIESSSVSELVTTIKKVSPSAIIWSAGAGGGDPSRTDTVDRKGAIKAMDAAAEAGVKRYVVVSALDIRDKSRPEPEWYDDSDLKRSERLWGAIRPFMEAKFDADKSLAEDNERRHLDWTIVRPGQLTDNEAKGTVSAGRVHLGNPVSREDVAATVVECLQNDGTIGMAFDVLGGDVPIKEAVQGVVERKEDCFEGFY